MKTYRKGRLYNTENAIFIGRAKSKGKEMEEWDVALYKTPRSGEYFLAGTGGEMTVFSKHTNDNKWEANSKIIPITEEKAKQWAENYLSKEIKNHYFFKK